MGKKSTRCLAGSPSRTSRKIPVLPPLRRDDEYEGTRFQSSRREARGIGTQPSNLASVPYGAQRRPIGPAPLTHLTATRRLSRCHRPRGEHPDDRRSSTCVPRQRPLTSGRFLPPPQSRRARASRFSVSRTDAPPGRGGQRETPAHDGRRAPRPRPPTASTGRSRQPRSPPTAQRGSAVDATLWTLEERPTATAPTATAGHTSHRRPFRTPTPVYRKEVGRLNTDGARTTEVARAPSPAAAGRCRQRQRVTW